MVSSQKRQLIFVEIVDIPLDGRANHPIQTTGDQEAVVLPSSWVVEVLVAMVEADSAEVVSVVVASVAVEPVAGFKESSE